MRWFRLGGTADPTPASSVPLDLAVMPEPRESAEALERADALEKAEMLETLPPAADTTPAPEPAAAPTALFAPDLLAAARLCTELSQVYDTRDVAPLLQELARVIDAVGLIVWVWDPQAAELTPALPHGYSEEVLAQLPNVPRDARNATAAAFRSAQTCVVSGGDVASDALVVPLMTGAGCAGVLAIELQHGGAQREATRALATIFAAQMARVVGAERPNVAASRRLA